MNRQLYLIDASVYVFRAWFSIPDTVIDDDGRPANAVFGFGTFLCDVIERQAPSHLLCAFDESLQSSFRNELYPAYKANRPLPPRDLERQFRICRELAAAMGMPALGSRRFEADDLVGSAAERFRDDGYRMVYVTADKDYVQLMEPGDYWWDAARDRWLDVAAATRKLGVRPDQLADFLALAGDSIDNIPGVPGVGPKSASELLAALDTLEGLYARLEAVLGLTLRGATRIHRLLDEHREQAFLSRELSRIRRDAPLECRADDLAWRGVDGARLAALPLPTQLRSRCRRLARRVPADTGEGLEP